MTPEDRIDRLERLAKLFASHGLRWRNEFQKKLEILMDAQMRTEAACGRYEERFARNEERFAQLAESQIHSDQRLDALIDIIRQDRNGNSLPDS
ncbi:MAG TPA: hypothetical protein VJU86_16100 [Pyrinomonadaceae bacterium]|nr:hypothetical protein [Pyrinomonadaceae bacterium]